MLNKLQEKFNQINWTSLAIGAILGIGAYYLYQNYGKSN